MQPSALFERGVPMVRSGFVGDIIMLLALSLSASAAAFASKNTAPLLSTTSGETLSAIGCDDIGLFCNAWAK